MWGMSISVWTHVAIFIMDALWRSITMTGLTVFNNLISILPVYGLVSHFTLNAKQWLIAEQNREDTSSLEWNMNYRPLRFNSVCLLSCSKEFQTNYFQKCCQLSINTLAVPGNILLACWVAEKNWTDCRIIIFRTIFSGTFFVLILNKSQECLMHFWKIFRGTELLALWIYRLTVLWGLQNWIMQVCRTAVDMHRVSLHLSVMLQKH